MVTAFWLQLAPMLVRLEAVTAPLAHPMAILLRWIACGTAVSGAFHAVSGATGLTVTAPTGVLPKSDPIVAAKGAGLSVRFQISSSQYGIAKAYTYRSLPAGLARVASKTDTVQGTPTASGQFVATVIGWEKSNASGHSAEFTVVFKIQGQPPVITQQPTGQTAEVGADVSFGVTATGEAPLTYRWLFEDLEINATTPTLKLVGVTAANAGRYRVRVNSAAGATFSDYATLTVKPVVQPPTLLSQSTDMTVYPGETVRLRVVVAGGVASETPVVTWQKDGVSLAGLVGPTVLLDPVDGSSSGEYLARVQGVGGIIFSAPIRISVAALPVVASAPDPAGIQILFPSVPGREYVLEGRSALDAPWNARRVLRPLSLTTEVQEAAAVDAQFFRLLVSPLP